MPPVEQAGPPPPFPLPVTGGVAVDGKLNQAQVDGMLAKWNTAYDKWTAQTQQAADDKHMVGVAGVVTSSAAALTGMIKAFTDIGLQYKAARIMEELQDNMETHKYNLADKSLDNDAAKTVAAEKITLEKFKLTEKVATVNAREVTKRAKNHDTAMVNVAGKQLAHQATFQRRFAGDPVKVLV